jgi:hypothetical protein
MVATRSDYKLSNEEYFEALQDFIGQHIAEIKSAERDAKQFFKCNPGRYFYVRKPTALERSGLYGSGVDVAIVQKSGISLPDFFRIQTDVENTDEFAIRIIVRHIVSSKKNGNGSLPYSLNYSP